MSGGEEERVGQFCHRSLSSSKLEALVGGKFFAEFGPAAGGLHVEAVQVNREKLGIENIDEAIDGGREALSI